MKGWTTREARYAKDWAANPTPDGLQHLASTVNRSPDAVKEFLRRCFPPGERPWREKPRWRTDEVANLERGRRPRQRSAEATRKYVRRRERMEKEGEDRTVLTITQVAADLGMSRGKVYRLIACQWLRRFDGGIAESSFHELLREHPEAVPFHRLGREHQEWLIVNGYPDPNADNVKKPSVRGLLKG